MPDLNAHIIETYDLEAVTKRNGDFMVGYLKMAFGREEPDFKEKFTSRFQQFVTDAASSIAEIQRLYVLLDGLRRRHMPHPGEPGAPVVCTSCSMHGGQVPWPCETFKAADAAIPEGWLR
jgi:hypothetical protein